MKNIVIIGMLFLFVLSLGCTSQEINGDSNSLNSDSEVDKKETNTNLQSESKAICGNGIVEEGETYENCCKDVECPPTFKCSSTMKAGDIVYYCEKIELTETYEFSKFIEGYKRYSSYDTEQSSSAYDKLLKDVETSKNYLNTLKEQGYDVSTYFFFIDTYERRIKFNRVIYTEKLSFSNEASSTVIIKQIEEAIQLYKDEKIHLQSINSSMKKELDEKMDYDIDIKISHIDDVIVELETLKTQISLGYKAELFFVNFESRCHSYSSGKEEGYVNRIYIDIKNTGGFDINKPVLDVFLLKGTKEIDKDLGNTVSYSKLKTGETISYEYYGMLGYSKEGSGCGNYQIKVNLRDGSSSTVISSDTYTISID